MTMKILIKLEIDTEKKHSFKDTLVGSNAFTIYSQIVVVKHAIDLFPE